MVILVLKKFVVKVLLENSTHNLKKLSNVRQKHKIH